MKIDPKDFRVPEGVEVDLDKWPTDVAKVYKSRQDYHSMLDDHIVRLSAQQQLLYASDRHAVLLIFQAMDAAGKDGVIKHVMSGVNPQGCQVFSFKHPSAEELQHDFLWRTTRDLPERGRIGIFNRSYYEEVLIVRVHPELLRNEGLPDLPSEDKKIWQSRYRSILDWNVICTTTEPGWSSSSCMSRRRSSGSASCNESMNRDEELEVQPGGY